MGRSGGGHHGGGGFHGGGGHHGGGFHGGGGGFHHHHHHYHGGGGGGDICSAIVSCAVFIIIIIIIFFAFIFSVLIESSTQYVDGTLSECEQIVVCPDTLKGNIAYTSKSTGVVAVLVNSLPSISSVPETRNKEYASKYLSMDDYVYRSFNLVKGSTIHWDIRGTGTFKIILMKGYNNFKNYENLESYNYIDSDYTSWSEKSYTASYSAEYFIVVEAYYGSVTLKTINYTIDYLRYEYEGYEKKTCLSTCDFDIDSSYIPGACVIASFHVVLLVQMMFPLRMMKNMVLFITYALFLLLFWVWQLLVQSLVVLSTLFARRFHMAQFMADLVALILL